MKAIIQLLHTRLLVPLLLLAVCTQYACKHNDSGTPVISKVALLDSTKRDSGITAVLPGTLIRITGSNFDDLQLVYFNDLSASFNTALNTSSSIIITVPVTTPTGADGSVVPNTIKVVTTHGVATYTFTILLPPPVIKSVSNENALTGATVTVKGSNFYEITGVQFGSTAATSFSLVNDTVLTAVVPALTAGVPLIVSGAYGADTTAFNLNTANYPATGFLANFENGSAYMGWQYWGGAYTNYTPGYLSSFPGNTGDFIVINPASTVKAGDATWYSDNRAVMVAAGAWMSDAALSDAVSSYALKFEVSVASGTTWTNGAIIIVPNGNFNYMARYAPYETAANGSFITNGWQTVTIPLTSILSGSGSYNASGSPASSIIALTGGTSSAAIQLMLYNDSAADFTGFNVGFDNVRIVKVN